MSINTEQVKQTLKQLRTALLSQRSFRGIWTGRLSSSALSTATAVFALSLIDRQAHANLIEKGLHWLSQSQNQDGGWGDTVDSPSNLSTSMLTYSALSIDHKHTYAETASKAETYLRTHTGTLHPKALVQAVETTYGNDKTFSIPILTMCALAGRLGPDGWRYVRPLPFELAVLPRRLFQWLRLPVVSYALPALIAVGQVRHHHHPPQCPVKRAARSLSTSKTLSLLAAIQPDNGGFLEAAPLTAFVAMSLAGCGLSDHQVVQKATAFLVQAARSDGSWPIDTNLTTWVTTLAINALGTGGAIGETLSDSERQRIIDWLLDTQHKHRHPYTDTAPGGWAWSDLPGAVPDADDTSGVLLALHNLAPQDEQVRNAAVAGLRWLLGIQNRDGGFPTFCRGWTKLPFDRSCPDITAHAIAAFALWQDSVDVRLRRKLNRSCQHAVRYLRRTQRTDGTWWPLWFGNQMAPKHGNPVYGTARVLAHLRHLDEGKNVRLRGARLNACNALLVRQNADGGWGGDWNVSSSIEETGLAIEALTSTHAQDTQAAVERGLAWLCERLISEKRNEPTPIGLYFARLWYGEATYPLVFSLGAFERIHSSQFSSCSSL